MCLFAIGILRNLRKRYKEALSPLERVLDFSVKEMDCEDAQIYCMTIALLIQLYELEDDCSRAYQNIKPTISVLKTICNLNIDQYSDFLNSTLVSMASYSIMERHYNEAELIL